MSCIENVNPWDFSRDISKLPSETHYEAAKRVVHMDARAFLANQSNFALSEKQLYKILSTIAKSNGRLITDNIETIGLKSERYRYKLALKGSKNEGPAVASGFSHYKINKIRWVQEVALSAFKQNPRSTPKHIQQFPLPDESFRFQLLKIAVKHDSSKALELVKIFNITKPGYIFEIAKIKAANDPWNFIFEVPNWDIPREDRRADLANIASSGRYREIVLENLNNFMLSPDSLKNS